MAIYRGPGGTGDTTRGESVEGPNTTITQLTGIEGPIKKPTLIEFAVGDLNPTPRQLTWDTSEDKLAIGLVSGDEHVLTTADIGVDVQAYSTNLDEFATVNPTTAGLALLDDVDAAAQRNTLGLGTAATTDSTDYATSAQGALADTSVQPGDLAAVATSGDYGDLLNLPTLGTAAATDIGDYATAAQGSLADTALQSGDNVSELNNDAGYSTTTGTVTSVSLTVPTGLSVAGSPLTSSGSLDVTYAAGYAIPTTAKQSDWDAAFGWGDHSLAGYYLASNPSGYTTNTGTVTSIDLTAGTGVSVSGGPITSSGSITVTNTAPDQTVVLTGGTGISTSGTYPNFTITNSDTGSAQNIFKNVAVSGQSTVVADSNNDTLTLAAGSNVTITTDATTDTITIASSGGGGGGINYQIITSSTTWEVPSGITRAKITVIGGGGGGSGNKTNSPQNSGAFGGNGGVAIALITDLSGSYSVTIGAGGTGGDGGTTTSTGGNGGNSSFGALLSATGGTGASGETSGVSGTGTVSSGTTIRSSAKGNGLPSEVSGLSKQGNANGGGSSASAYSVSAEYGAGHGGASANIISETPYTGGGGIGGVVIIEY